MDILEANLQNTNRHPWEISRANSVIKILKQNDPATTQYADIGAGDLFFTKQLTHITNMPVFAVDINYNDLNNTDKIVKQREIEKIPPNSIDYATVLDVIEHVKEEDVFVNAICRILKDQGRIIITVPAHQFLFYSHDVFLKHYRRYNKKQLVSLLNKNGFEVEETFYFYSLLFVIRCFQVLLSKIYIFNNNVQGIGNWNAPENNVRTVLITRFLNMDFSINRFFAKKGINLWGLSLCAICRKKYA